MIFNVNMRVLQKKKKKHGCNMCVPMSLIIANPYVEEENHSVSKTAGHWFRGQITLILLYNKVKVKIEVSFLVQ